MTVASISQSHGPDRSPLCSTGALCFHPPASRARYRETACFFYSYHFILGYLLVVFGTC
jgi:hypothetical protein